MNELCCSGTASAVLQQSQSGDADLEMVPVPSGDCQTPGPRSSTVVTSRPLLALDQWAPKS